jgi:hypothetical protein
LLPDVPILRRAPLQTGSGYTFDPFAIITRGPRDLTVERELDIEANFAAQQASLHEDHHWIQWIGTSMGLFLTAVRFSQEQTAGLMSELPPGLRRKLKDERMGSPSSPIVYLDSASALDGKSERGNRRLGSLAQGWYDHLLTYRLFADSDVVDGIPWDLATGLAETLCDVASTLDLKGVTDRYDYAESLRHLDFTDLPGRVGVEGERLTTTLILEGAASVDELLGAIAVANKLPQWGDALAVALVERLRSGSYGLALRLFGRLVHGDVDAVFADLFTFGLVCDIALNPPLPPVTPILDTPTSWNELYPPIRFARACAAVKLLSARLTAESNHTDFVSVRDAVCEVAAMTVANETAVLDGYQQVDWLDLASAEKEAATQACALPGDYGYFDFLLWCGTQARQLRLRDIRLLINPAFRITIGDRGAIDLRIEGRGAGWYHSPAWALGDGFGFSEPIRSWFGTWLVTKSVAGACVHDWMAGTSALDLSWLPQQLRAHQTDVWDAALDRLLDL